MMKITSSGDVAGQRFKRHEHKFITVEICLNDTDSREIVMNP